MVGVCGIQRSALKCSQRKLISDAELWTSSVNVCWGGGLDSGMGKTGNRTNKGLHKRATMSLTMGVNWCIAACPPGHDSVELLPSSGHDVSPQNDWCLLSELKGKNKKWERQLISVKQMPFSWSKWESSSVKKTGPLPGALWKHGFWNLLLKPCNPTSL